MNCPLDGGMRNTQLNFVNCIPIVGKQTEKVEFRELRIGRTKGKRKEVEFCELHIGGTEGKHKTLNFVNFCVSVLFLEVEFRELPVRWRNAKHAVEFRELHIGRTKGKRKEVEFRELRIYILW